MQGVCGWFFFFSFFGRFFWVAAPGGRSRNPDPGGWHSTAASPVFRQSPMHRAPCPPAACSIFRPRPGPRQRQGPPRHPGRHLHRRGARTSMKLNVKGKSRNRHGRAVSISLRHTGAQRFIGVLQRGIGQRPRRLNGAAVSTYKGRYILQMPFERYRYRYCNLYSSYGR